MKFAKYLPRFHFYVKTFTHIQLKIFITLWNIITTPNSLLYANGFVIVYEYLDWLMLSFGNAAHIHTLTCMHRRYIQVFIVLGRTWTASLLTNGRHQINLNEMVEVLLYFGNWQWRVFTIEKVSHTHQLKYKSKIKQVRKGWVHVQPNISYSPKIQKSERETCFQVLPMAMI